MNNIDGKVYAEALRIIKKHVRKDAEDMLQEAAARYVQLPFTPDNSVNWLVSRARLRNTDAWRKETTRVTAETEFLRRVSDGVAASPHRMVEAAQVLRSMPERHRWWLVGQVLRGTDGSSTQRDRAARFRASMAQV